MPACAEMNWTIQDLIGVNYKSGEQNKDMTSARKERHIQDTVIILCALQDRDPFLPGHQLRNIMTGLHTDCSVNVEDARNVGEKILASMTGLSVTDYIFQTKCTSHYSGSRPSCGENW